MGVSPGKSNIFNLSMPTANTEYSLVLPVYTTHLTIQARGNASVKICFTAGESGSTYFTIKAGGCYYDQNIRANKTLYAQSSADNEVLEVVCWGDGF